MAGLAKSPRDNSITVIRVADKDEFVKEFNRHILTEERMEELRKIGEFFGIKRK